MMPNPDVEKDLLNRFNYHRPGEEAMDHHQVIRESALDLAYVIVSLVPDCRERSLALTNLEQAMFWANAAIARVDKDGARR